MSARLFSRAARAARAGLSAGPATVPIGPRIAAARLGPRPGPLRSGLPFSTLPPLRSAKPALATAPTADKPEPKYSKFTQLANAPNFSDVLVRNLTIGLKLESMTDVQALTIESTLNDEDVIGQAKTGTGKTLAFLVPLANRILSELPHLASTKKLDRSLRPSIGDTRALIVSPTRELAEQIAAEARRLLAGTQVRVQIAVGGTQRRQALADMAHHGCHLLVATPGRLKDLLQDPHSGVTLEHLNGFVLDEADRLLDDGFWPEIRQIVSTFPDSSQTPRQTLLFSATMTREVRKLASQVIKPEHSFISTVDPNEQPTHERIPQHIVKTNGYENLFPAVYEICARRRQEDPNFKAVMFFNSTAEVSFGRSLLSGLGYGTNHPLHPTEMLELHGKLTQGQRTNAARRFREARSAILFCSDVAARGMDFPGVTDVIQVGPPSQLDSYIHRIGRTGRAGANGQGWLVVPSFELAEMSHLRSVPLKANDTIETATVDMSSPTELPDGPAAQILSSLTRSAQRTTDEARKSVYGNILFRLCSPRSQNWNQRVADSLNRMATLGWGMDAPPGIHPPRDLRPVIQRIQGLNFAPRDNLFSGSGSGGRDGGMREYSNGPAPGESQPDRGRPRSGGRDGFRSRSQGGAPRDGAGGFRGRPHSGRDGRDGRDGRSGGNRTQSWMGRGSRSSRE